MNCKLIFLSLFVVTILTVDPLPLPQKFTQAFTLSDEDGDSCTGKIFYDSTTLSQKVSMIGDSNYCCDDDHDSCSYMLINGTAYLILPSDKACCFIKDFQLNSIPRDVFAQYFTYLGQKIVDNDKCYLWVSPDDQLVQLGVFTDESPKRIMKKVIIEVHSQSTYQTEVNFWPGSYSEKFSDKTVFEIPTYCTDQCDFGNAANLLKSFKRTSQIIQNKNLHFQGQSKQE